MMKGINMTTLLLQMGLSLDLQLEVTKKAKPEKKEPEKKGPAAKVVGDDGRADSNMNMFDDLFG